jgi:ubiquinone/menaquinone biosynthesis C-methylase UbiE
MQKKAKKNIKTSWGDVADWYDDLLKKDNTYQSEVILPNLLRLMEIKNSDNVLDLACGQGIFARAFAKIGAKVTGVDISSELIKIAKAENSLNINYIVSPADNLTFIKNESLDKISIILALQNIDNLNGVIKECNRVLKTKGKLYIVLNHPAFRIPRKSDWGYDEKNKIQYRRVEKYLSEIMINIDMNPGEKITKNKKYTVSFHRPLQLYFKVLNTAGFLVSNLEEWISNKKSQNGKRQKAEDVARKEIPMFMCIEAVKNYEKC